MTTSPLLLFVYGTLRRACTIGAHEKYLGNAKFIGQGRVQAQLYQVSYYPALVLTAENHWVIGEIYQLADENSLACIDNYECCSPDYPQPHEYQRVIQPVLLDNGKALTAWCYVYQHNLQTLTLLPTGDFLALQ